MSYEVPCYLPQDKPVTGPDKVGFFFQLKITNTFLNSPWKHVVVLIRMASLRCFLWVPTTYIYREIRNKCGFPFFSRSIQAYLYHAYNLLTFISHGFTHFCCCFFYVRHFAKLCLSFGLHAQLLYALLVTEDYHETCDFCDLTNKTHFAYC